jgi:glycosyltransferase involved in cell wall biosynthesis
MMMPLVSILIPAYNSEAWIADTIKSAVAQTWPRKEIIVVDDGSSDDTVRIAQRFSGDGVHVMSKKNAGAAAARNTAFSLSKGDYIQWLDADDLLSPEKIAKQMEVVQRACGPWTLLSSGWGYFMYRQHRADLRPTALWCDLSPAEWLTRKLEHNLHMQTATWLVSRELTEAAGPWNTQMLGDDDGEYFCRVLLESDGVRFVREGGVYYRRTGSSRLSYIGRSSRKIEAQFHSMRLHIDYLLSLQNTPRTRAACVTYLQNWLINFYPERPDIVKEAEALTASLGGRLEPPQLSWKYDWIRQLFGWTLAKRAQEELRGARWAVARGFDRMLSGADRLRLARSAR